MEGYGHYDDNYLVYNEAIHMYVPTRQGAKDLLGEDLALILNADTDVNPTTLPERYMIKAAMSVKDYILGASRTPSVPEWIMAQDRDMRGNVQEMLYAQLSYTLANGFIGEMSGINIQKGTAMRYEDMRGDLLVDRTVERIANEIMPKYGFCLRCGKALRPIPKKHYRVGY